MKLSSNEKKVLKIIGELRAEGIEPDHIAVGFDSPFDFYQTVELLDSLKEKKVISTDQHGIYYINLLGPVIK